MTHTLKITFVVSVVLAVLWTFAAAMAQGAGGLAVVGLFFAIYPLFGAIFLFAAWNWWKHPEHRKLAGWTMAMPVIAWFLPSLIRSLAGGALSSSQFATMVVVTIVAAIASAWLFPRKVSRFVPDWLVGSRFFNWLILLAMVGAWAFLALVIGYVASQDPAAVSSSGAAVAYVVILAALYLLGIGLGSFGAATWAWVSLRGGFENTARKLNIAQLVVAMPGVLIAIAVASWLVEQGRL